MKFWGFRAKRWFDDPPSKKFYVGLFLEKTEIDTSLKKDNNTTVNLCQSIWKWTEESRCDFLIMSHPFYGKGMKHEQNTLSSKKKLCALLKKNFKSLYLNISVAATVQRLCISSLNNFCTLLKWQKLFQKLSSAWPFAPSHVLPTCSTFWYIASSVCQGHLHWELRFVVGDEFFFISPQVSIFITIMCFRVLLDSL